MAPRRPEREQILSHDVVTAEDIEYVIERIGVFGDDNRAGIELTLHRISAIRSPVTSGTKISKHAPRVLFCRSLKVPRC